MIHWLKITDSTNSDALRNRDTAADKTVWAAEYQSAGRGQRGNKWESKSGENLMFTILFKPSSLRVKEQFSISAAVALGVVDYLSSIGLDASVKWPNDIYVGDRKICGILIENTLSCDRLSASIVGIGLNMNQRTFPSDLPNPTSAVMELERTGHRTADGFDLHSELPHLLEKIFCRYAVIETADGRDRLMDEYISFLYRLNRPQWFEETEYSHLATDANCDNENVSETKFEGVIRGVEKDTFRLLVEKEGGDIVSYFFKEIRFLVQ